MARIVGLEATNSRRRHVTELIALYADAAALMLHHLQPVDTRSCHGIGFTRPIGMRGPKVGEFDIIHHMAADSKGNLYGAEIVTNRRAQRFVLQK